MPDTLCVTIGDPGGPLDGLAFPIFAEVNDAGCARSGITQSRTWIAYGTPPAGAGLVEWFQDSDPYSSGYCMGYFRLACVQDTQSHYFTFWAVSSDFCDLAPAYALPAVHCNPPKVVFTATTQNAYNAVHPCPGTSGRTVTVTVWADMSHCPSWTALFHLRKCPGGIPTTLYVHFTVTAPGGESQCGLGGKSYALRYYGCSTTGALVGCVLYTGTAPYTGGASTAAGSTWNFLISSTPAGVLSFHMNLMAVNGQFLCPNSLNGNLSIDSCGPAVQFTAVNFYLGGSFCPCPLLPTYTATITN